MQETKIAVVNGREIPVLISDEKEALLAAKAAGGAIIGLWRPGQEMDEISAAKYVVENPEDATEEYLERVARRYLGLPWHICESERLLIREMFADDFDEVWSNQIGHGFGSIEEMEAYTKHQYAFYEFGFWALVEKTTGNLVGMAGLTIPGDMDTEMSISDGERLEHYRLRVEDMMDPEAVNAQSVKKEKTPENQVAGEILELGYHVFPYYRRQGYAKEACQAIIRYGIEELNVSEFIVRIAKDNEKSKNLAAGLGFKIGR